MDSTTAIIAFEVGGSGRLVWICGKLSRKVKSVAKDVAIDFNNNVIHCIDGVVNKVRHRIGAG